MGVFFVLSLVVLVQLILIYRHITRNFNYWKELGVPYLSPVPIFGNIFKVISLKESLGVFAKEVYNYLDTRFTGFFVFDQPFLLIRDPELIKSVCIKDFEYFDNRSLTISPHDDKIAGYFLFVLKNPTWRKIRTQLSPVFTSGKMKGMLHLILDVSESLKKHIDYVIEKSDGFTDSREMWMKYTTDVISSCAFGIDAESLKDDNSVFRAVARRCFIFTARRSIQMGSFFTAPWLAKLFRMKFIEPSSAKFMRKTFLQLMYKRKESIVKRADLIDFLLEMRNQYNDFLDDDILVSQAVQFFLAGFETTGNTITFACYELALNKDLQNRLREEVKETIKEHGELSYKVLMEMKYLDAVVCETLRMYPAVTFLDRRCAKPYKIPNTDITIREGTAVYISLLGLHMDPNYFPEPKKFDPDRFLEENRKALAPFTYMPFGEGPRICVASRFALLSVKSALTALILNYEIEPVSNTPVPIVIDPKSGFLISPLGGKVPLRFKRCS